MTLDVRIVSSSHMLGMEPALKKMMEGDIICTISGTEQIIILKRIEKDLFLYSMKVI